MKKIFFVLIILSIIGSLILIFRPQKYYEEISVDKFNELKDQKQNFVIYIGRDDCNDCLSFEPTFHEVIKNNNYEKDIKYVNVKEIRKQSKEGWKEFKENNHFDQTPVIIHYEHGKIVDKIEWDAEKGLPKSELEDWLLRNI